MIDPTVIIRDTRYDINEWASVIRYNGREINCQCAAAAAGITVLDGALLDDMDLTIICLRLDFLGNVPAEYQYVELRLSDGTWREFEVRRRPDFYDPVNPMLPLILGNPAK